MSEGQWKQYADAATVDIVAARTSVSAGDNETLEHLRDAQRNLTQAIEALESEIEERE